jgi:isopenicillin N synthase-like dioxygenase
VGREFHSIPVIDIAGLRSPAQEKRLAVAEQIRAAARDVGFFYVAGHGIPQSARDGLLAAAKRFFDQSLATKMESYIGRSVNHSGYVPEGEEVFVAGKVDKKEAYDVGYDAPPGTPSTATMLGPNLWPDLPGFRAEVAAYYAQVEAMARTLFRGFALAIGIDEQAFEAKLTQPPSQLRMIHYPYDADAVDGEGIGAHTDYECFTILFSTAPGLEVMNGAGEWIDAPPIPDCFIINISDMMETWTNGAFIATSHRVRKVAEERYSFPYFAACDYWTVVEPLEAYVSADSPARYPRIISGEHLYAQTAQTFGYLKKRIAAGEAALPADAKALSSFGQEARRTLA